jgi:hypothetical protein
MFGTFFFDIYKWLIFIFSSQNLDDLDENKKIEKQNKIERRTKLLNIILIILQICLILISVVFIVAFIKNIGN